MNLIDSIGGGLMGSDYMKARGAVGEAGQTLKNLFGQNDTMYRLPSDMSMLGFIPDPVLRRLPPSLRHVAKRKIDLLGLEGIKIVNGFINGMLAAAKDAVANKLKDKLKDKLKLNDESIGILGLDRKVQPTYPLSRITFTKNDTYQESKSGVSGYEVEVTNDMYDPTINPYSNDCENKVAELDLTNSLKFRPREDTLWYIVLDRYSKNDGNLYNTALPEVPTFINEFDESGHINYLKWLPAVDYNYSRRSVHNAIDTSYGWGHGFKQISSITRGGQFSITLEDDRIHSFSKYCKEVANRSACYEQATVTYWETLLHKITIFILDKQWRISEKFTLLGILQSDGSNRYSNDISGKLILDFDIVGEITNKNDRVIESLS